MLVKMLSAVGCLLLPALHWTSSSPEMYIFTVHLIVLLKVYNLMIWGIFTEWCNHLHYLVPEGFYLTPKKEPHTH